MPNLLEKLGLKRKKKGQPATSPPPTNPQPTVTPPVQQSAPWQAPVRGQQRPPRDESRPTLGEGRLVAETQREAFEKKLEQSMPIVRRAKQLMQTIDVRRIEASKANKESELTKNLEQLSSQMQAWQRALDQQSSLVRGKAEDRDWAAALEELDKGLKIAHQMLGQEDAFYKLLAKAQLQSPTERAGDFESTPEFREVSDKAAELRPLIEEALAVRSENGAVRNEQARLRASFGTFEKKFDGKDYAAAKDALDDAAEAASLVLTLAKAAAGYESHRREVETLVLAVAALEPTPQIAGPRQQVLDDFRASRELAERGRFGEAAQLLHQVRATIQTAFSDEMLAAQHHAQSMANVMPTIEKALAADCPCQPVVEQKRQLAGVKDKLRQAEREHRYEDARKLMEVGVQYANTILRLATRWSDYAAEEERAQVILAAAGQLKPTKSDQLKQQKGLKAGLEAAARQAMQGNITAARQTLAQTVASAQALLRAVASPALEEFCKEWAADQKYLDTAAAVKLPLKVVTDSQAVLAQARNEVQQAVQTGDAEGAAYLHGIAMTRAAYVHQLADRYEAYTRAQKVYQATFDAALQCDAKIPGVADGQQQLKREITTAGTLLQTDPARAAATLHAAAKTAHRIVALAEQQAKQQARHGELKQTLDQVKKSYLPAGMSDQLAGQTGLKDGREFDAVLAAMKAAETAKTEQNLDHLAKAAGDWLALFGAMPKEQQSDPTIQRRKQICETALKQAKHLKLALRLDAIGQPPWDQRKEDEAADLHVKILLETGDVPLERERGGVTGAAWIKSMDWEEGKAKRQFIFKRTDVPSEPIIGFPEGGEAPREVLADEVGKQLKALTGLDFNVPETRLIGIDSSKFPDAQPGKEVVGSAQAAAPTIGSVADVHDGQPDLFKKISPKEVQKSGHLRHDRPEHGPASGQLPGHAARRRWKLRSGADR